MFLLVLKCQGSVSLKKQKPLFLKAKILLSQGLSKITEWHTQECKL